MQAVHADVARSASVAVAVLGSLRAEPGAVRGSQAAAVARTERGAMRGSVHGYSPGSGGRRHGRGGVRDRGSVAPTQLAAGLVGPVGALRQFGLLLQQLFLFQLRFIFN